MKKNNLKRLGVEEWESMLGESLTDHVKSKIEEFDLVYSEISNGQRDKLIIQALHTLTDEDIEVSGKHRIGRWEIGWGENYDAYKKDDSVNSSLIPLYFGKIPFVRVSQRWIHVQSKNFEYNCLGVLLEWIFEKYLISHSDIYEFGCGTGHNIYRLRTLNRKANLNGLDWAESSQNIIRLFAEKSNDRNLNAFNFNFFSPPNDFKLKENSSIYTIAALEQVGENYKPFVDFILQNKPSLCIHLEPIGEVLDPENLLDLISIKYFEKRNYLKGFLSYLRELEDLGRVEIHNVQRTNVGSFYIEGYSLIVWSPV